MGVQGKSCKYESCTIENSITQSQEHRNTIPLLLKYFSKVKHQHNFFLWVSGPPHYIGKHLNHEIGADRLGGRLYYWGQCMAGKLRAIQSYWT